MFTSGIGFFALFGLGWWLLGVGGLDGPVRVAAIVAGCLVTAGVLFAAARVLPTVAVAPISADRRRSFNRVNGVQWLLIAVIAVTCGRAGQPVLIAPLIAIVVGLHFFPLAAVFAEPRLRVPGAALIAAGAVGLVLHLADAPAITVRLGVGAASAATLWATAAWTLRGMASALTPR